MWASRLLWPPLLAAARCRAVILGRQQTEGELAGDVDRSPGFERFTLEGYDSALCLDGSPAGGYERIVPNSSTVVLQLQGGGYCDDFESCFQRVADDQSGLGGSASWPRECGMKLCTGIVSPSCQENPDFCGASLVLLRFCSGDHWRGTRTQPTVLCSGEHPEKNCASFRFSGENILDAALQRLISQGALRRGSKLVLAGRSSGGVGVLNLIDRVREERLTPSGVDVRGLLLWSVDVDYPTLPEYRIQWFKSGHARDQMDTHRKHELYQQRVPGACTDIDPSFEHTPWLCKPHEMVRHLKTPVFVATNFWSSLAIGDFVLNKTTCSYVRSYGQAARSAYEGLASSRADHGLFAASCFAHTVPWETSVATPACGDAGCSLRDVFGSWYFGDGRGPTVAVEQDCDSIPCNNQCTSQRASNLLGKCARTSGARTDASGLASSAAANLRRDVEAIDLQPQHATLVKSRPGPRGAFPPEKPIDGEEGGVNCEKLIRDLSRDGYVVLRNALPKSVIDGALEGMNGILGHYADVLQSESLINSSFSDLPLDQRAMAIFQDHPEVVPKFFRSELHSFREFYDLFTHRTPRNVAECVLKTKTLVMYPVYMGRMNLPNIQQHENGFHQDSLYTYEYFNINATAESMETFMSSKVNFWAPLTDVDRETGTLMVRRGFENRLSRYSEWTRKIYGHNITELVTDVSELPLGEVVVLDDLKAGDLVVFAHRTPHRGTSNRSPDRVRWSMDWRLQNGQFSTMREESGYLVQSDLWGDTSVVTRERWADVKPGPRWTERESGTRTQTKSMTKNRWTRMELDGSHTATAPRSCVRVASAKGRKQKHDKLAACTHWKDHP